MPPDPLPYHVTAHSYGLAINYSSKPNFCHPLLSQCLNETLMYMYQAFNTLTVGDFIQNCLAGGNVNIGFISGCRDTCALGMTLPLPLPLSLKLPRYHTRHVYYAQISLTLLQLLTDCLPLFNIHTFAICRIPQFPAQKVYRVLKGQWWATTITYPSRRS